MSSSLGVKKPAFKSKRPASSSSAAVKRAPPCVALDKDRAAKMTLEEIMAANPIRASDVKMVSDSPGNYAVVTYWWGCGNANKNTQLPCPEDVVPGQPLKQEPIKFEKMIARFGKTCRKAKCHYLAKEYPEFAVPGGYQKAINAKPLFIKAALETAKGRGLGGVLYIDGDMDMKTCPLVFNMRDVDVALRGWNIDPRSSQRAMETGNICFDPTVLETSGGTMFFSTSPASFNLLDMWILQSAKDAKKGKADDRILSELIYANRLNVSMNIIQLPIEYLWLSQYYDDFHADGAERALITHPLCLTGEERAADQGAATNRAPKLYERTVEQNIECGGHGGVFYERVFFESEEMAVEFKPYLDYIRGTVLYKDEDEPIPAMYVVPWKEGFGKHTVTVNTNFEALKEFKASESAPRLTAPFSVNGKLVDVPFIELNAKDPRTDIVRILHHLVNHGEYVVYYPTKKNAAVNGALDKITKVMEYPQKKATPQFVAVNVSDNEFRPNIDPKEPLLFAPGCPVLVKMLLMCKTPANINDIFRSSYIFWSRIRCEWIDA